MNKDIERELIKEYGKIASNLNNNPSEEYLDQLLETFTQQLSNISESKNDYKNSRKLLRSLKSVKANSNDIELTEDQKIIGSLEKIQIIYNDDRKLTEEQINRKYEGLKPYLDILENVDLDDLNIEDEAFLDFLEKLLAKNRKGKFTISKIYSLEEPTPTHERFTSYFNDEGAQKAKKVKTKRPLDEEFNCYYEMNLLLALKNSGICEQSDLNRIKSLGTGSLLTESIKKVIPKSKHHRIKPLVKIQNEKYKEYLQAQSRLIK